MVKKLLLVFAGILIASCTSPPSPTPTPAANQADLEEQAVYAYLLPTMYRHTGYVIMDTTSTDLGGVDNTTKTLDYILQNLHGVDDGTVVSFRTRNNKAYPIRDDMNLGFPYTLLSQATRNHIFGENQSGWDVFYNRYPQAPGITTLSRVGFNPTFDQALVYIGTQSNWLAGAGYYILLKKAAGAWTIDQQVMSWIS